MSYVALCCFNCIASAAFFNMLFSLKAVKISLEIYDNQLSKWENRMLVIKIIKLHEIYPTSANICISLSCILIKHHVSVAIRLRRLWWKWEKSANDWRGFSCTWSCFKALLAITCRCHCRHFRVPDVCSSLQLLLKEVTPGKTKTYWLETEFWARNCKGEGGGRQMCFGRIIFFLVESEPIYWYHTFR